MKVTFSILSVFLAFFPIIGFSQGLIFDDSIKFELNSTYQEAEVSRAPLPTNVSLKAYTPWVHHQLGSECLAYSMATAHTIIQAIAYDWTDREKISHNSFSPHFIYYRNRFSEDDDCTMGLDPRIVAADALENGMAYLHDVECPDYYPCSMEQRLCGYYPPDYEEDQAIASQNKIDNIYMLENIQQIRTVIASARPVVVGMMLTESFVNCQQDLWQPIEGETVDKDMGHAMVVVAYDDFKYGGAIQLMNSWGKKWGNEGFIWVTYEDAMDYLYFGLALDRLIGAFAENEDATEQSPSNMEDDNQDDLVSDTEVVPESTEPIEEEPTDDGLFQWVFDVFNSAYEYFFGEDTVAGGPLDANAQADLKLGLGVPLDSIDIDYPRMAVEQARN